MPISKKRKYPSRKRRDIRTRPEAGGSISIIDTPEMPTQREIAAFHVFGVDYYNFGRRTKADGEKVLTFDGFVEGFGLGDYDREYPGDFPSVVAHAQYEQYIAGYTGAEYHDIVFRKVNI